MLLDKIRKAPRVYIVGNGGSYANALHLQNDLIACGIKAYTLDPSTLTAIANDHGYEYIFSLWLFTVAEPGDLLIALSGSGKSKNILNAVAAAESIGMEVEKVFGAEQGLDMQASEERQLQIGHELRKALLENRPR